MCAGWASDCACDTLIVSDVVVCFTLSFWVASAFPASPSAEVPASASTASLMIVFIPLPFLLRNEKSPSIRRGFPDEVDLRRRLRCRPSGRAGSARATVGNEPSIRLNADKTTLIPGAHEVSEELPVVALVPRQLHLVHRVVVAGRGLDPHPREQERVHLVEMGRRLEDACAGKVPTSLPERVHHGVCDCHSVVVEHVVGLRAR